MFLLRKPVSSAEDVAGTAQAAKDGLVWLDEIDTLAEELGVLRGSLSRWLLPYDSNTPTLDQAAGATMAAEDGSVEAQLRAGGVEARLFEASISVEDRHRLVASAVQLRGLVRVKIADDADLAQARVAVRTVVAFFTALNEEAEKSGEAAHTILGTL